MSEIFCDYCSLLINPKDENFIMCKNKCNNFLCEKCSKMTKTRGSKNSFYSEYIDWCDTCIWWEIS